MKKKVLYAIAAVILGQATVQAQCSWTASISSSAPQNSCAGTTVTLTAVTTSTVGPWVKKAFVGSAAPSAVDFQGVGFSVNGNGYIVKNGGQVWKYDPLADAWTQKNNFPGVARPYAIAFSIGSKGYYGTGGYGTSGSPLRSDFWEYTPATDTWVQKTNFPGGIRSGAVAFTINGKGYVGLGSASSGLKNDFWEYNSQSDSWQQKTNFPGTARSGAVGFGIGTLGYIGTGQDASGLKKDFWEFNTATNTWQQKADYAGMARTSAVGFAVSGKGIIGAGSTAINSLSSEFWTYSPLSNTWTMEEGSNYNTTNAFCFVINNKAYYGGGYDYYNDDQESFYEYKPLSYVWSTGATTKSIAVTTGGTYEVTVTSPDGCSDYNYKIISIENPSFTISGSSAICKGFATTLTGVGSSSYTYLWSANAGGAATKTVQVAPATTTVYTLTATSGNCVTAHTHTLTVYNTPTITVTGPDSICFGKSAVLTASGAQSYNWSTNETTNSVTVSPASSTFYFVEGVDLHGCYATEVVSLTVLSKPVLSISGPASVCKGNSIVLTVSGATTYSWSANAGNAFTNSVSVTPSVSTTYSVVGTNAYGCEGSTRKTITVLQPPVLAISGVNAICKNESTVLTATGGITYAWSANAGSATTSQAAVTVSATSTYTVVGQGSNGCTGNATKTIVAIDLPVISISGADVLCRGNTTLLTASGASTYSWSSNAGSVNTSTVNLHPSSTTSYTVSGTQNGCSNSTIKIITVHNLPAVSISGVSYMNEGQHTTLTATGAVSYVWSANAGGVTTYTADVVPHIVGTVYYSVIGTDANGCSKEWTHTIIAGAPLERKGFFSDDHSSLSDTTTVFGLYPNPATSLIYLQKKSNVNFASLHIYDNTGRLILTESVTQNLTPIDMSAFAQGLYYISVSSDTNEVLYRSRFIKQ